MSCFGISHSPQFTDVNGIVRENINQKIKFRYDLYSWVFR